MGTIAYMTTRNIFLCILLYIFFFSIALFSFNDTLEASRNPLDSINKAYQNSDFQTAQDLLTKAIDSGKYNGKQLGRLFAMRSIAYQKLGMTQRAWDDCMLAAQLIPDGNEHKNILQMIEDLRFEKVETMLIGGIPISQGWNDFKWGASVEEFKIKFPKHKHFKNSWETGEGNEVFSGVSVKSRYIFNSNNEFCQVILYPSKENRPKLTNAMLDLFGWTENKTAVWKHSNIEITVKIHGVVASIRNTDLDFSVQGQSTQQPHSSSKKIHKDDKPQKTYIGCIEKINSDWGLVIIEIENSTSIETNDHLIGYTKDGGQVHLIVQKIVTGKAVARIPNMAMKKLQIGSKVFKFE
jgi:tetratricopeptide (TPR) repeat protein